MDVHAPYPVSRHLIRLPSMRLASRASFIGITAASTCAQRALEATEKSSWLTPGQIDALQKITEEMGLNIAQASTLLHEAKIEFETKHIALRLILNDDEAIVIARNATTDYHAKRALKKYAEAMAPLGEQPPAPQTPPGQIPVDEEGIRYNGRGKGLLNMREHCHALSMRVRPYPHASDPRLRLIKVTAQISRQAPEVQ